MRVLVAALVGYFLGTVPTADIVARLAARAGGGPGADLRRAGTGNPGALNAAKVLGWKWGAVVLAGDVAKGAIASLAGRATGGANGAYAAATAAVVGHCFPVWSGFRGGKGVATSAGTTLGCFPAYAAVDVGLAAALTVLSRGRAEAATYITSAAFVLAAMYWWLAKRKNAWGPEPTVGLPLYALITSAVIAHRFLSVPRLEAAPGEAGVPGPQSGWKPDPPVEEAAS